MSNFEDFPKKCIKCNRKDVKLHKFQYSKSSGTIFSDSYSTVSISFPVCGECKIDINSYLKIKDNASNFLLGAVCLTIIIIIIGVIMGITDNNLIVIQSILIAITIVLLVISTVLYISSKTHPHRISKFLVINIRSGTIKVKNDEYRGEIINKKIADHITSIANIDAIYCPKCGTKQMTQTDFCRACGKELRMR